MAPLSAAEKQKRYSACHDAGQERRKKKVSDLSEGEKRAQRKKWQERKRKQRDSARARMNFVNDIISQVHSNTPGQENAQPGPSVIEKS